METCCWILFVWEATPIFYVLCCAIIMCAFYLKLYYPFTILVSLYWTVKDYFSRTPNRKILKHTSKWCAIQIGVQTDPMTPHVMQIAMVAFFTVRKASDGTYEEKLYIYGHSCIWIILSWKDQGEPHISKVIYRKHNCQKSINRHQYECINGDVRGNVNQVLHSLANK